MFFEMRTRPRGGGVWGGVRAGFGFLVLGRGFRGEIAFFFGLLYNFVMENLQKNLEGKQNIFEKEPVFQFALLDPRPIDVAKEANEKVFQNAEQGVLGIEVTIPALAERCTLGNIDPQHSEGDVSKAAIDIVAIMENLPPEKAYLATVRADLDAIGSMALIDLRRKGLVLNESVRNRIEKISEMDRFDRGEWQQKSFPTKENIWAGTNGEELSLLNSLVMDFKVPVQDRVKNIEKWLEKGEMLQTYTEKTIKEREALVQALENGEIKIEVVADGKIAKVESKHQAGTMLGYAKAPVIAVSNPEFKLAGGEPHLKHTIAQYKLGYIDLKAALEELKQKEEGWGGSPTIIGSPQGVSSKLSNDEVIEIISKYLIRN